MYIWILNPGNLTVIPVSPYSWENPENPGEWLHHSTYKAVEGGTAKTYFFAFIL